MQTTHIGTAQSDCPSVSLTHHRTSNVQEHVARLPGWSLQYQQLSPGCFSGEIAILNLNGVQLIRERTYQSIVKNGTSRQGRISFSFPMVASDGGAYCAGHAINQHSMLVAPADNLPELRTPHHLDLLCISVDEYCLASLFDDADSILQNTPRYYPLHLRDNRAAWQMLTLSMMEAPLHSASLLSFQPIQEALRDTVLTYLSEMVDDSNSITLYSSARKRIVDQACSFMLAHRDNPPSILELCQQVGASRRKLQYCFQETLGINPATYLRLLRLNGVHHDLLTGALTVQNAAAKWGFWHLSRFAVDYRQLFSESPSATLQKQRQRCANFG